MWWKHFKVFMIFSFTCFTQVKRSVKSKFIHLKEHQQMLWSRFLIQEGSLYPHMEMLIEILLVLQGSSAVKSALIWNLFPSNIFLDYSCLSISLGLDRYICLTLQSPIKPLAMKCRTSNYFA